MDQEFSEDYQKPAKYKGFQLALIVLINQHSMEIDSNTPDFILAEYLTECLELWERTVSSREEWHGRKPSDWV